MVHRGAIVPPLTGRPGLLFVFVFQAEDGIRDRDVTGVQTCALPISTRAAQSSRRGPLTTGSRTCASICSARCTRLATALKQCGRAAILNSVVENYPNTSIAHSHLAPCPSPRRSCL